MDVRCLTAALVGLLFAAPVAGQTAEFGGQIRPRFEVRDPVRGLGTTEFTSMRARVDARFLVNDAVTVFVQLQDVRVFGEEASTLEFSADGLDLHQGWMELGRPDGEWSVRVGRQEAIYGGQRLIGAVNWTQQARAFDGARVRYRPAADVTVDGLAFRIADRTGGAASDESLYGVYSTVPVAGAVDLYGLLHTADGPGGVRDLYTVGARWAGEVGRWSGRLEGSYQAGTSETPVGFEREIGAFMVGARAGTAVTDRLTVTLWYDYLSGDADLADGEVRFFDTLFATNHKFYGFMDFFLDIPNHTRGRGLQDAAVKLAFAPADRHSVRAALHAFRVASDEGLATPRIGEELDLTYRFAWMPGVTAVAGASYFVSEGATQPTSAPEEDQLWGYVMLNVVF